MEADKVTNLMPATQSLRWYPITDTFLESIPPGCYCLHSKEFPNREHTPDYKSCASNEITIKADSVGVNSEPISMNFLINSIDQEFKKYNGLIILGKDSGCEHKDPKQIQEILKNLNAMFNMRFDSYIPVHVEVSMPPIIKKEEAAIPILRQIHNPLAPPQPIVSSSSGNVARPQQISHYNLVQNDRNKMLGMRMQCQTPQPRLEAPRKVLSYYQQQPHHGQQNHLQSQVSQLIQPLTKQRRKTQAPHPHHVQPPLQQQRLLASQGVGYQPQQQQQIHTRPVHQRFQPSHSQKTQPQQGYQIVARELQTRFSNFSTNTASTTQVFIYTVAPRPTMPICGPGLAEQRKSAPNIGAPYNVKL